MKLTNMKVFAGINKARKNEEEDDSAKVERILSDKSDFDTVENYKIIRTNIMFSLAKTEGGKVISITSSAPGEGKTTTTINLAITFAQTGAKVVIVDCDMRKARIHRYLQIKRDTGVSNILCGFSSVDKALKRNVRENLDVLTAGEIPPNPAELLESAEFEKMITELKGRYDYVFVDTPPLTMVTDGTVVAKQCTGIVIVVRENLTTYGLLDETVETMQKAGMKVLGVIMLGAVEKGKKYYRSGKYGYKYGYKYKYGYHYGDDEIGRAHV